MKLNKLNKFNDFVDKKNETKINNLKDNHIDTQDFRKNSKLEYDYTTKKMTDFSKSELDALEQELEDRENIKEAIQNTFNSMSRLMLDYEQTHNPDEHSGFVEGMTIFQNADDIEDTIKQINKSIERYSSSRAKNLTDDKKQSLIKGLEDALKNIKTTMGENIKESMSYKMIKESKKYRNQKLKNDLMRLIREHRENLPINESKELSDHYLRRLLLDIESEI